MPAPVETLPELKAADKPPVVVKKYANRRLYNTESSSYITLDNLADMVRLGRDFIVYDAKKRRRYHPQCLDPDHCRGRGQGPEFAAYQLPAPV